MGKKKSRASYTSKGGLGGRFTAGASVKSPLEKAVNQWKAFKAGKKVYTTIPNPDPQRTDQRWIRVEMKSIYGDSRRKN